MKALTGNRLDDGEVVFWAAGGWVLQFQDAELFSDPDLAAAAEGEAKTQTKVVVDPYLIATGAFPDLTIRRFRPEIPIEVRALVSRNVQLSRSAAFVLSTLRTVTQAISLRLNSRM